MTTARNPLQLEVLAQPDNTTCGPTCLHALYRYWGLDLDLRQVIDEVPPLPDGGTLAVSLACHALRQGYKAEIYTYNLQLFDPTWFSEGARMTELLREQQLSKPQDQKFAIVTEAYLEYLELGGVVHFEELTTHLLTGFLDRGIPVLTGLSATYLYRCARERDDRYDAVGGQPTGHFVVINGLDRSQRQVTIADPLQANPTFSPHVYSVSIDRLINSILLGILTYDANLLIIQPKSASEPTEPLNPR